MRHDLPTFVPPIKATRKQSPKGDPRAFSAFSVGPVVGDEAVFVGTSPLGELTDPVATGLTKPGGSLKPGGRLAAIPRHRGVWDGQEYVWGSLRPQILMADASIDRYGHDGSVRSYGAVYFLRSRPTLHFDPSDTACDLLLSPLRIAEPSN